MLKPGTLFALLMIGALSGCHPRPDHIAMDFEVGYPLLFGEGRTWAVYRLPRATVPAVIDPDRVLFFRVVCDQDSTRCRIASVADNALNDGMWFKGTVLGESEDASEAFVIPDEFPLDTPNDGHSLALTPGITKMIRVSFRRLPDGQLKVSHLRYIGETRRDPVIWK
jgi:hypothetical protein